MPEPDLIQQQREALRAFRQASAENARAETGDEAQYKSARAAADADLARARQTADEQLARAQKCHAEARSSLLWLGLERLLEQRSLEPPASAAGARPAEELARCVSAADQARQVIVSETAALQAWREAVAARRRLVIRVALGVGLVVIAAVSWGAYQAVRAWHKERLYQTASMALSLQQWDEARAALKQLLAIDDAYRDAPTLLRESYYRPAAAAMEAEQWEEARSNLEPLLQLDSSYEDAPILLRESYYRPAMAAIEAGQWEEARSNLKPLLQLDSAYKDAATLLRESYYRPAVAAIAVEDWPAAAAALLPLWQLDRGYKDVLQLLAGHAALREAMAEQVDAPGIPAEVFLAQPPVVRDQDGMTVVNVPAGEFLMGSRDGEGGAEEHPQHTVYLDAFWIDKTEVTNAQYEACVEAGACQAAHCADDSDLNAPQQPVVCVDWFRAETYCKWVGARLPTEAEWEKAARGTDGRRYPWGNADATCEYAVMDDGSGNGCGAGSYAWPVGSKPAGASPYGALDMAGNVWEWVADWYAEDYYGRSPARNPTGPDSGQYRGLRGGSWFKSLRFAVRAADRNWNNPGGGGNVIGFRCAASTPSPERPETAVVSWSGGRCHREKTITTCSRPPPCGMDGRAEYRIALPGVVGPWSKLRAGRDTDLDTDARKARRG